MNPSIAETPSRPRSLRMALICLGLAVGASLLSAAEHTFVNLTVLAMGVGFVGPIWYRWIQGRLDWFEPIHVFGAVYFLYFGLGSLWVVGDPTTMAYDTNLALYVPKSAFYCLLGQWALLAAYFAPGHLDKSIFKPGEWPRGYLLVGGIGGIGFVGYLAVAMVERGVQVDSRVLTSISPVAQLSPLFLFAWALAWLLYYSDRSTRSQRLVLFCGLLPAAMCILYITVSDKSLIMTIGGIPIVSRWYGRGKIPWSVLIAMILVLVFVVFPMYNTFRWSDPHENNAERLENTYRTVQTWGADTYLLRSIEAFKFRTALINSMAIVVRDSGRWVPFARGETLFVPALVSVVPRYLWPDKPILRPGREFGRLFRITNYWSRDTYIAATMPGELYWNFHLPGVVVGMALFGYGMRWLYRKYGQRGTYDPMRTAMMILIVVQLAHFHGSIALDMIVVLRLLVMLAALRWVARRMELVELRDEHGALIKA